MRRPRLFARTSFLTLSLLTTLALVHCGEHPPTEAECNEYSNQASLQRRAAQDSAERACTTDAECVLVDYGLDCFADCGYPSAVARSGVSALEDRIESVDEEYCGAFERRSCPGPIIPPCAPPFGTPTAVCVSGRCDVVETPFN